ncbi:MAG: OmpA family protein, partial [Myxococcales bacterium]|nr:OmpA family protein [Myxococcales bacterium]
GQLAALTFAKGSAALPADCNETGEIAGVVSWAAEHPDGLIVLAGHADPEASQAQGLRISVRRAKAVRGLLVAAGTNPEQIVIAAFDADGARDRSVVIWGTPAQRDVVASR